jgi:hypothetical protein
MAEGNALNNNEGKLCGTIFFPFFFLLLETEDGVLVFFVFILLLNQTRWRRMVSASPVFLLFEARSVVSGQAV